jgi:hypothetical protein
MFGIFKSNYDRAVTATADFIANMVGKPRVSVLSDPYCLGFLDIVSRHVAAEALKGSAQSQKAQAVLVDALKIIAPSHASDVAEALPMIRSETSPSNASYLRGKKDGDTFMRYKLLHLAPQCDGEAALQRFYDRMRHIMSPSLAWGRPAGAGITEQEQTRDSPSGSSAQRLQEQPLQTPDRIARLEIASDHMTTGSLWFVGGLGVCGCEKQRRGDVYYHLRRGRFWVPAVLVRSFPLYCREFQLPPIIGNFNCGSSTFPSD